MRWEGTLRAAPGEAKAHWAEPYSVGAGLSTVWMERVELGRAGGAGI